MFESTNKPTLNLFSLRLWHWVNSLPIVFFNCTTRIAVRDISPPNHEDYGIKKSEIAKFKFTCSFWQRPSNWFSLCGYRINVPSVELKAQTPIVVIERKFETSSLNN